MKTSHLKTTGALLAAALLASPSVFAQSVESTVVVPAPTQSAVRETTIVQPQAPAVQETTTTTTTQGTLGEFGGQSISVNLDAGRPPVRYVSSETTNYVDESGAPLEISTVRPGVPVTIHYTKVGDTLVASRVVVRQSRTSTSTVTTPAPAPAPVLERQTTTTTTTSAPMKVKKDDDDDDDGK